ALEGVGGALGCPLHELGRFGGGQGVLARGQVLELRGAGDGVGIAFWAGDGDGGWDGGGEGDGDGAEGGVVFRFLLRLFFRLSGPFGVGVFRDDAGEGVLEGGAAAVGADD